MFPDKIYYEPNSLNYDLGKYLKSKYSDKEWIEIENHNNIKSLREKENKDFKELKQYLIIGTRKTHKYTPNFKVSDYLVPYTSSGCIAMCLYCYLVCNYNKCSYLRLFVNREQMLDKLMLFSRKTDNPLTYEIGSNSDLVLENTITNNLCYTIEEFAKKGRGKITFPTKFCMVDPLLNLNHQGKTIFRMSVNPHEIIHSIELGTSPLELRINAINKMCDSDYPVGILVAPVILIEGWKKLYRELMVKLKAGLSQKVQKSAFFEVIFMTYSYVHKAINTDAFPLSPNLYSQELMSGRGMGKYRYKPQIKEDAEQYMRGILQEFFPNNNIIYIC